MLLCLQINEKIGLGPAVFLEVHIVSKLKKAEVHILILVCKQTK
jgi:hypothetical protein